MPNKCMRFIEKKIREARDRRNAPQQAAAPQSPIDMLKAKFVNGEITAEEYETKKKILEG